MNSGNLYNLLAQHQLKKITFTVLHRCMVHHKFQETCYYNALGGTSSQNLGNHFSTLIYLIITTKLSNTEKQTTYHRKPYFDISNQLCKLIKLPHHFLYYTLLDQTHTINLMQGKKYYTI